MKWKYRFGAVMGNTLEYYDVAVFAAISPYLSAELTRLGYEQATEMVWGIFALRFLSRPIGGYIIGLYADKVGKKSALILTSFITGLATLSMAFLPIEFLGVYTPVAILIIQLALSFSFAGELPSLMTYLLKGANENEKGKVSSLIVCSSLLGFIISLGMVFLLEKYLSQDTMQSIGWRAPLFLGFINVLISFWFRRSLPEQCQNKKMESINTGRIVKVIFIAIPGAVVFYAQNISAMQIVEYLNIGEHRNIYVLISMFLLVLFIFIFGFITDKYSSPKKIFDIGVWGIVFFSIPLYITLYSSEIIYILLSQTLLIILSALILSSTCSMLFNGAVGGVVVLALGYNLAQTFVGGITPLFVSYFKDHNLAYIGMFISLISFSYLAYTFFIENGVFNRKK